MMPRLSRENWKTAVAFIIVYAYAYQLVVWAPLFWATTLLTAWTGHQWPGPPIVPWEQLFVGTSTLATIGGIETWRESVQAKAATAEQHYQDKRSDEANKD